MLSKRHLIFALFCLALFAPPLGVARTLFHRTLDERTVFATNASRERFESVLASQQFKNQLFADMANYFRGKWAFILSQRNPLSQIPQWQAELRSQYKNLVQFIHLDTSGNQVASLSDVVMPPGLGKTMLFDLVQAENGELAPLQQRMSAYRGFFGPVLGCRGRLAFQDGLERLDYRGRWTFGFFSALGPFGMHIILFRDNPNWELLRALIMLRQMLQQNPGLHGSMIDLHRPAHSWKRLFGRSAADVERLLQDPRSLDGEAIRIGKRFWAQRLVRDSWRIVFSWPVDEDPLLARNRTRADIVCCLAFLAGCLIAWRLLLAPQATAVSLRFKIGGLLLYVVGIPLLLLASTSLDFLREREEALIQETFQEQEHLIREFDREFMRGMGGVAIRIRQELSRPCSPPEQQPEILRHRVEALQSRFLVGLCSLVDDGGKCLFQNKGKWSAKAKPFLMALQNSASNLLNDLGKRGGESVRESTRNQLLKVTGDMFGFDVDRVIAFIAQRFEEIVCVNIAKESVLMTMIPVSDARGIPSFIGLFGWNDDGLQPEWMASKFPAWKKRLPMTVLYEGKKRDIRRQEAFRQIRDHLRDRIDSSILPVRYRFRENGRLMLMTGFRGMNLFKYRFYLFSDDRRIQAELQRMMAPFLFLVLALLALTWGVAAEVARRFLLPVGYLMQGVEAIRQRRFDKPIPLLQRDELGHLTVAFNEMLEGLKELEVAKILQDSLFPSTSLALSGWSVCGTCQAASRVGGDYFDFFALPDGRLVLLIGDVSGHGTSAALVVAMAKALIIHPDTVHEPGPILDLLQGVFFNTLQRKKMMSCFCALFDPVTGVLLAANAGHNLPYLVRANGAVEQLKAGGKPLGTKNKPFVTHEYQLFENDWLFLYTDGFIEAQATDGREIGYDRAEAALPGLQGRDASETHHRLREWQAAWSAPVPQADDITVVVLQRSQGAIQQ